MLSWPTQRYGLWIAAITSISSDDKKVLTAAYIESGMPHVGLTDLLHLPNIYMS